MYSPSLLISLPPGWVLKTPKLLFPLAWIYTRWNWGWACPGLLTQGQIGKGIQSQPLEMTMLGPGGHLIQGLLQASCSPSNMGLILGWFALFFFT